MIESISGNILNADAEALVNPVNCVGVMGKGLALQFKQAFPAMFKAYHRAARAGEIYPGTIHTFKTKEEKIIINFPTKRHWKDASTLEDIDAGLEALRLEVLAQGISSIAIPPLGSGLGGLDWTVVRPRLVAWAERLPDVRILLYEPRATPLGAERRVAAEPEQLTTSRALLLSLLELYSIPSYALTLLELQKLAYFLQEAGQPLKLNFERHHYGPYAHNLNHVLRRLEGHYLVGAVDVSPETEIALIGEASQRAATFLQDDPEGLARLARVGALIEGFETPHGMELLATVHWICKEHPEASQDEARCVELVHAWSERKRRLMRPEHLRIAHRTLREQGWLETRAKEV